MQEQERDCQSMLGLKGDKGFDMECGQGKHIQQKKETIDKWQRLKDKDKQTRVQLQVSKDSQQTTLKKQQEGDRKKKGGKDINKML